MPAKKTTVSKSATPKVTPDTGGKKSVKQASTAKNLAKTGAVKAKPSGTIIPKPERTDVFVSYSHADKEWLTKLQIHLRPLKTHHNVVIWADTELRGGDKWRTEIEKALARAKAAILLVSAHFMASDFIINNELPPLLKAAEKDGVLILPIIVGQSGGFTISNLSQFQAMNGPTQPLNLMSPGQVDQILTQVFTRVYEFFVKPTTPAKSGKKSTSKITPEPVVQPSPDKRPVRIKLESRPKQTENSRSGGNKALLVKQTGEWEMITVTKSSVKNNLTVSLNATTSQQRAFLTSLRQQNQLKSIVLGLQTYVCTDVDIHQQTEGTKETWHLTASVQALARKAQITFSAVTPDMQAEAQAKLLLLNTPLPNDQSYPYRLTSLAAPFTASCFPALFSQLSKQQALFKQAAPLIATWFLQMNNIVEHILLLSLTLKGKVLDVHFKGQRSTQYPQEKPAVVEIKGKCDLSKSEGADLIKLGPVNRY
ncbi:toll/interleukin-1 receptor domain-containing protein [Spirosoma rhododendri]|uniref:Toll/interleukin-1 receptor domain-containing protein n=1 Tax=Spirosoma rhododendri TaxID=2728024 RepID=A0A7L5DTV0_9BACT|nr:toll/interleukin-1 receptor domain-containing protein [Spirosoma rhododendri]QJD81545.1 toll/interleukin-1 receptor domain-containing protein [Spirosoma rhododendri]